MELYLAGSQQPFERVEREDDLMELYLAGEYVFTGERKLDKLKDFIKPGKLFIDSGAFSAWTKGAKTRTATIRGAFQVNSELRKEAYSLLQIN